jgi:hypothetical protein
MVHCSFDLSYGKRDLAGFLPQYEMSGDLGYETYLAANIENISHDAFKIVGRKVTLEQH